jgi:soluble lytic murein transglycosylase-like protein
MTSLRLLCACAIAGLLLGAAVPVQAQIYMCKNGDELIYTGQPSRCGGSPAYAVAGAKSPILASRPAALGSTTAYDNIIETAAADYDVRPDLVRAVIQVESGYDPRARSNKGAMGLMQLMPMTASDLGVRNPYNPTENIRGGVAYLKSLLDRYSDETLALAAYNAGPTAVEKYGNAVPPYRETQQYVDRVQTIRGAGPKPVRGHTIYKTMVAVDGQLVPRYSDTKPSTGPYEIVRR